MSSILIVFFSRYFAFFGFSMDLAWSSRFTLRSFRCMRAETSTLYVYFIFGILRASGVLFAIGLWLAPTSYA